MSLLIVIFAMMVFAVLGWTLNVMQATESQFGVRMLDSERALYLAESGMQEALMRIRIGDALFDQDTDQLSRTFGQGRYTVTRSTDTNLVTVTATGSYPAQNPHATRQVQAVIDTQIFMRRSGMIKNLFDWSAMLNGSRVDGAMAVIDRPSSTDDGYEGNGALPHNQPFDIAVPGSGDRLRLEDDRSYPNIDMNYFKNAANGWWPLGGVWEWPVMTARITAVTEINNQRLRIDVDTAVFTADTLSPTCSGTSGPGPAKRLLFLCVWSDRGWQNKVIIRNRRDDAVSLAAKWDYRNWGVITSRVDDDTVELTFDSSVNIRQAANVWHVNDEIVIAKRFAGDYDLQNLWYVAGDVLIDVRDSDASFMKTSIIAEGDIVIRGDEKVEMQAFRATSPIFETYPNLATQRGDIYSPDRPKQQGGGGGDPSRAKYREFDGLVYSQDGDILMNYMEGVSLMGNNVTVQGYARIKYSDRFIESNGLLSTVTMIQWREQ